MRTFGVSKFFSFENAEYVDKQYFFNISPAEVLSTAGFYF